MLLRCKTLPHFLVISCLQSSWHSFMSLYIFHINPALCYHNNSSPCDLYIGMFISWSSPNYVFDCITQYTAAYDLYSTLFSCPKILLCSFENQHYFIYFLLPCILTEHFAVLFFWRHSKSLFNISFHKALA